MCNKAIYLLPRGNVLHIVASHWDAPRLTLLFFRLFLGALETVSSGPHACDSSLPPLFCWTQAILVRRANLILCLFCTKQTITTLGGRVADNESVKSMFSCSILCVATGSSRRKWRSGFKSIHLRTFFTAVFGSLQINIIAFRAHSNYNPSADGFV